MAGEHGIIDKRAPSAAGVHCDSWDGTVVCFGLTSTKLGTPVYPQAIFQDPFPTALFVDQSLTDFNHPHKLGGGELGPLR
jgi:hypothetical protein